MLDLHPVNAEPGAVPTARVRLRDVCCGDYLAELPGLGLAGHAHLPGMGTRPVTVAPRKDGGVDLIFDRARDLIAALKRDHELGRKSIRMWPRYRLADEDGAS